MFEDDHDHDHDNNHDNNHDSDNDNNNNNNNSPVLRVAVSKTRPTSPVRDTDVIIVFENGSNDDDNVTGAVAAVAAATIVPALRRIGIEIRLHSSSDHRAPMTYAERVRDRTRRAPVNTLVRVLRARGKGDLGEKKSELASENNLAEK